MNTQAWRSIPHPLAYRAMWHGDTLHISEELRGNLVLDSYISLVQRQGVGSMHWHDAEAFDNFRLHADNSQGVAANPVQEQAMHILYEAFAAGASDIHIAYHATHGSIRMRRMGMLEAHGQKLGGEDTITLIRAFYQSMTEAGSPQFSPLERQEGRIVNRAYLPPTVYSVRVHTEPLECAHGQGMLMTLRLLYDKTQASGSLHQRLAILGYAENERIKLEYLAKRGGLTLVAGPTGHGKSTLLKHVIESQAFEMPERAFLSIEDPPEYPIHRVSQILVTGTGERRGEAYKEAVAGAMRADPDVIMIGEVRYPEAAVAAVDAALTGHTVWTSIHAGSAFGIVGRMLSLLTSANFADPMQYICDPEVFAGLIYQRLLPVLCPQCKQALPHIMQGDVATRQEYILPRTATLKRLRTLIPSLESVFVRGLGCEHCSHTGIERLTVAPEVIVMDAQLAKLLYKRDMSRAFAYWKQEGQGTTSHEYALQMIAQGLLDPLDAENRLGSPLSPVTNLGASQKMGQSFGQDGGAA